jgi:hypothetical protein
VKPLRLADRVGREGQAPHLGADLANRFRVRSSLAEGRDQLVHLLLSVGCGRRRCGGSRLVGTSHERCRGGQVTPRCHGESDDGPTAQRLPFEALNMVSAFSVIAMIAVSAQLAILVALHVLPTKYDPVRDAISDYGVGDYHRYFWAQLAAGALAFISVAVALTGLHPYVPTLVVVLLFTNATARFLMPAFPTDQSGNRFETVKGTIHMLLAVVAFGAVAAAATDLGGLFSHYPAWHSAKTLLVTVGWVVLAGAVACAIGLVGPRLKNIFGLIERFFTLSVIVWIYLISIELIRL